MNEHDLITALGPLAPLWSDPMVQQIIVDAPDRVFVERGGRLEDTTITFAAPEAIRSVIDATLALGGVALGSEQTIGELRLPSGTRMMAVIPPTAIEGPCLSLRRAAHEALTWERLLAFGSLTAEAHEVILRAVRASASILIAGNTGSGKTTVANLVAGSIPAEKHVVVVEQRHEMWVQHPRRIYLEAGGPANVSLTDLFDTAEQLRPEWVIVGEMRGPEALRALQVMSVGHSGLINLHAESPEDALARLEAMCLMANMGLGLSEIRALIASALHLLIYQQRLHDGRRRITHIIELRGVEHDRIQLQPLFRYDPDTERLEATGAHPAWEGQGRS